MKHIFLYSLFSIFLFSCGDSVEITDKDVDEIDKKENPNLPDNFEITGRIQGAVNQPLTLEAVSNQGTIKIAETTVGQDGDFFLKGNIQGLGMYQLKLGIMDTKVVPLCLEPKDKVQLKANYDKFEMLPVWSGTSWANPLNEYMSKFNDFANKQVEFSKDIKNKDLTQEQQIAEFLKMKSPLDLYAKNQMLKDLSNPVNIILITSLTPSMGYQYWDEGYLDVLTKVSKAYSSKYKESPIAESLLSQVKQIESGLKEYKVSKSGNKLAPEITLKNTEGKIIKLSSLKGNVILIDFWASWCGPCRRENPNVVRLYNKYKDKGFTVYSVSLDNDAEAWKRAIKADGLIWPSHVSDLKGWDTPLIQLYNFNSIPYTVLVGRNGKILGTNLRGESLEQKLKEVL